MSGGAVWNFEPTVPVEIADGPKMLGQPVFALYHDIVMNIIYVSVILIITAWLIRRKLNKSPYPGRLQVAAEFLVGGFDGLCKQVLGPHTGRKMLPLVGTLFLFLWASNMMGLIKIDTLTGGKVFDGPDGMCYIGGDKITEDIDGDGDYEPYVGDTADLGDNKVYDAGFPIPRFLEPTRNINVPLGLALLFFIITLAFQIKRHGPLAPIKELFDPIWLLFPLNAIGKVAEIASVSFRLFGNVFGGVVIIVVVSHLLHEFLVPVGLDFFFGIFVGTIQAFVFTMLNLTYFSMAVGTDEEVDENAVGEAVSAGTVQEAAADG